MSDNVQTCPQCGEALTRELPGGLCPRCVMRMNLLGDTVPGKSGGIPAVEDLAPHFPQLEILECLGRGGMGIVYKARQPQLDRFVALKILAPERVDDARFAERFRREAVSLARLDHPNIVTVYDTGESGGYYFLLMEFVDGVSLREAIAGEKMPAREALAIVPEICAGLEYAHEQGVVHRDIKPENILLDRKGRVKIADFGVAKLMSGDDEAMAGEASENGDDPGLTLGGKLGTPQYMAPEQAAAAETDHRADIYAVGVVFYEMLTGERPKEDLVPPSRKVELDVRIDEIVLRALEKEPAKRYQSAGEFRTVVETMAEAGPPPVAPGPPVAAESAPVVPVKRKKSPYVVVGIGCLAMILIVPVLISVFVLLAYNSKKAEAVKMETKMRKEAMWLVQEDKRKALDAAAAKAGNPLEGSFRGLVDGQVVEWHIFEFAGGYRWLTSASGSGVPLARQGEALVGGDHSEGVMFRPMMPGADGIWFERTSTVGSPVHPPVALRRVNHGVKALVAGRNMQGLVRWVDEVMRPFMAGGLDVAKQPDEQEAVGKMLGLLDELQDAASRGDWTRIEALMQEERVSPENEAVMRRMLRAEDARYRGEVAGVADRSGAEEAVRAYMGALRDLDVDRAYGMWAAEGELDDPRRDQMLRDARELKAAYQQDPDRLNTITEWYREGIYAVGRASPPEGGDDTRSVFLILVSKPEGWKVVDFNDIRANESLKSTLDRLLDRN